MLLKLVSAVYLFKGFAFSTKFLNFLIPALVLVRGTVFHSASSSHAEGYIDCRRRALSLTSLATERSPTLNNSTTYWKNTILNCNITIRYIFLCGTDFCATEGGCTPCPRGGQAIADRGDFWSFALELLRNLVAF